MPKDIKIKEKDSHYIRKLDRRIAFTSRVKRNVSNQYEKLKKVIDENNKYISYYEGMVEDAPAEIKEKEYKSIIRFIYNLI